MHSAHVIVGSHCLDDAVVSAEFPSNSQTERLKNCSSLISTLRTTAERGPEGDVGPGATQFAGHAVIIVAAGNYATVDVEYQLRGHRKVIGEGTQPTVGRIG